MNSYTHHIKILRVNDSKTEILLTLLNKKAILRDFNLIYTAQNFELPSITLGRTDINTTAMISFIPKFCNLDLEDSKLAVIKDN